MTQHSVISDEVLPNLRHRIRYCMCLRLGFIDELHALTLDICPVHFPPICRLWISDAGLHKPIVFSTPGLQVHLIRPWAHFLHHENLWRASTSEADIGLVLSLFVDDPVVTDNIDDGNGRLDLASLIIKHVDMITSDVSTGDTLEEYLYQALPRLAGNRITGVVTELLRRFAKKQSIDVVEVHQPIYS
ncbi:hypothetical protein MVEN_01752800 [Mycena venus]|uniref:Uncharacterized protein n=1 Tax=Mycena venus TaxID=2733690 RepID=A0A8H6XKD6_9AGAR|nr:hypothetical protein MVEN_01752800 [Mycena venus]